MELFLKAAVGGVIQAQTLLAQVSLHGHDLLTDEGEKAVAVDLAEGVEDTGAQEIASQAILDREGAAGAAGLGPDKEEEPANVRKVTKNLFDEDPPHQACGAGEKHGLTGEMVGNIGHRSEAPCRAGALSVRPSTGVQAPRRVGPAYLAGLTEAPSP